ncbi:hypothetical protein E4U16_001418 [Claviceps sp. LM84 group G4]|nr:hypothetical protein E4U33_000881 [Claviceps sp. LM78 group G4]KAG6078805.1 hypothetical protein E4U16_001418 [Claviceps sp. LM84 group G4]
MLPLRRTLRIRLPPHTKIAPSRSRHISVSTHQCIRQRPVIRRVTEVQHSAKTESHKDADLGIARRAAAPEHPQAPSPPNTRSVESANASADTSPDTSASGPYKDVLLSSAFIAHQYRAPIATSNSSRNASITTTTTTTAHSYITTCPSPLLARQLSVIETFFVSKKNRYKLLYSAAHARQHRPNMHTPEIILLGASNAGKSTFLNAILGSVSAARVSRRPGLTTLMNVFGVGPPPTIITHQPSVSAKDIDPPQHSLILVDTPGYGFRSQLTWGESIIQYLDQRTMLRGAVLLLSSEKKLLPHDKWMLRTLAEANTRTLVVLTKADKSKAGWKERCVEMADDIQTEMADLNREVGGRWRSDDDGAPTARVLITAAGMDLPHRFRNGAGIGGVRSAILDMAGFSMTSKVTKKAETVTYSGPIVSFEDIEWTTSESTR